MYYNSSMSSFQYRSLLRIPPCECACVYVCVCWGEGQLGCSNFIWSPFIHSGYKHYKQTCCISFFLNMHINWLLMNRKREFSNAKFLVHCISRILCWTFVDPQRDRTHYARLVISNFYSPTLIMVSFPTCLFIPQLPRVLTRFIFIEQSHMIVTCLRYC